jgi:cytochrome c-type biogenesis protein CcmH/NrfG
MSAVGFLALASFRQGRMKKAEKYEMMMKMNVISDETSR